MQPHHSRPTLFSPSNLQIPKIVNFLNPIGQAYLVGFAHTADWFVVAAVMRARRALEEERLLVELEKDVVAVGERGEHW